MLSVLTTKRWPLHPPEAPSEEAIHQKRLELDALNEEFSDFATIAELRKLNVASLEYAEMLRDGARFEAALEIAEKEAKQLEELIQHGEEDLEGDLIIAQMVVSSIMARMDEPGEAMRVIETYIPITLGKAEYDILLESLLIQRALLSYQFGHSSLATKDLDQALMLREKRTGELDTTILEMRHRILLIAEAPEDIEREHRRPV